MTLFSQELIITTMRLERPKPTTQTPFGRHTTQAVKPNPLGSTRQHLPPTPPASAYYQFQSNLGNLTTVQKQQLMGWLYKTNIATKSIVRIVSDPIVGNTGFTFLCRDDTPTIKQVVSRYQTFNTLHRKKTQRERVKHYVNTGEICVLTAPYLDTWYSVRCPSCLIRQTLLDPYNFQEIIGVVLEPGILGDQPIFYKTITDESRLSSVALKLREYMPYSCFYWANFEHDSIEDAPGWNVPSQIDKLLPQSLSGIYDWSRMQRRGEPFFATWSDLFNQLVEVLWSLLDKTKSWGAFNYNFQVDTTREATNFNESIAVVKQWRDAIGTPDMNTAIYTDQTVDIKPMNFPMQSNDMKKVMDLMFQLTGLSGNVAPYDLGANLNTTYATTRSQGGPQQQFSITIQTDIEDMLLDEYTYILHDAVQRGTIPQEELHILQEAV